MATGHIPQIFLRITVQNQIHVAQRVVIDKVVQFRLLRHSHIQYILDPGAAAPRSRCPCWICRLFPRTSCLCSFCLTAPLQLWPLWYGLFSDKVSDTQPSGRILHFAFQRKQKIRTLLLSRKGSDFHCLVRWKGLEPPAYWFVAQVRGNSSIMPPAVKHKILSIISNLSEFMFHVHW